MRRRTLLRAGLAGAVALAAPAGQAQDAIEEVIARVRRSVVGVGTLQRTRTPAFRFLGTGFAIGDGTRVATNAHVVDAAKELAHDEQLVVLLPGERPGELVREVTFRTARGRGEDREHDLALLAIDGAPLPALALGASASVREGRSVYFTGFPIGAVLGPVPVTHRAIVAAITPIALPAGRAAELNAAQIKRLTEGAFPVFQLDGVAYPGSSGSPVYEAGSGSVVAVLNMGLVKTTKEALLPQPTGIAYAIPVEHLARLVAQTR